jgi:hypothetical protein
MSLTKEFDILSPAHVVVKARESCEGEIEIKVKKTPLCDEKDETTSKQLDTTLLSGFATPAIQGANPSISENGDQVYLFYVNHFEAPLNTQPEAQLFNNVNNRLVVQQTIPFDSTYSYVAIGFASKDFTKFSAIDINPLTSEARIRVFNQNFSSPMAMKFFNDPNALFWMGGNFTEDGKYLLYAYAVLDGNSVNTLIFVLDANDPALGIVAGPLTISGWDYQPIGPYIFTLVDKRGDKNYYISFSNEQFDLAQYLAGGLFQVPPFFSQIYKVVPGTTSNPGTISLVDQLNLPKFAETSDVFVRKSRRDALICHGGYCSLVPSLPTIYEPITSDQICDFACKCSCDEVRSLRFNGKKLKVFFSQSGSCCTWLTVYPPSDGCQYFLGQAVDNFFTPGDLSDGRNSAPQEFYALFNLQEGPNGHVLRPQNGPFSDMKNAGTIFSRDGRYMLRVGTYGYLDGDPTLPNVDSVGIKNVLFFGVSTNKYKNNCDSCTISKVETNKKCPCNKPKETVKVVQKVMATTEVEKLKELAKKYENKSHKFLVRRVHQRRTVSK